MASPRARHVQVAVAVFVAVLALAAIAYSAGAVQMGSNIALRSSVVRRGAELVGAVLLGSALLSALWPRWRATQAKLFFSACCVVAMLALAELAARLIGHVAEPAHPRDSYWTADAEIGFVCLPNTRFRFLNAKGWVSGSTDAIGFRPSLAVADTDTAPTIICLGDSTTFSTEVQDHETWPEAAARGLAAQGRPTRMLNRGVSGYSGLQSLITLRRALAAPKKPRAVVYLFCFNDPTENFASFMPAPLLQRSEEGFVIQPPEQALVTAVGNLRIRPNSALLTAFRTWRFRTDEAAYRGGGLSLYSNLAGFIRRFVAEPDLQQGMKLVLTRMKEECDRHGVPLVVVNPPSPQWGGDETARAELEALLGKVVSREQFVADAKRYNNGTTILRQLTELVGAHWVDLRGGLAGLNYREYAASPYDWHFSAEANERIGAAIARQLVHFFN